MRNQTARPERLLALDIETVPDRERLPSEWGNRFPKPIHHRVACISFVEAEISIDDEGCERYTVASCRSGGEVSWDEKELLQAFWSYFAQRSTRVVGWNTRGFDMPVILQRSLVHGISAAPWFRSATRPDAYSYRYSDLWHADLMDMLADHGACQKLSLDDAARACGLPGKLGGHGSEVEAMVEAGEVEKVRRYCEGDVLNLYGLYLRHGLLNGRTTQAGHDAAVENLAAYLAIESATRPHMGEFVAGWRAIASVIDASNARP